jgi:guanylate kinase
MTPGPLIIVSGPSGSGKSTLIRRVLDEESMPLRLAISATTRPKREGEVEGVDYYFWTRERFKEELSKGAFLEHATVHERHYYGTPRSEVDSYLKQGMGVILDIDVQGAAQVRAIYPDHLSIFIALPRWEMYEERLRNRQSETNESIARRLETARRELEQKSNYHYVIFNDDLERAAAEFRRILASHLAARK